MKTLYQSIKWIILIGAYSFLAYKIATYNNYDALWSQLNNASYQSLVWLLAALALLPLNLYLESKKWQLLTANVYPQSITEAIKTVLKGQTGAFFTPNRIGEYPTRVIDFPTQKQLISIAMGFWGSLTQTAVITAVGAISAFLYINKNHVTFNHTWIVIIILCIITSIIVLIFASKLSTLFIKHGIFKKLEPLWEELTAFTPKANAKLIAISLLRYTVFSTQFYFALLACQTNIPITAAVVAIPTIYLCVTYTPSISFSEPAIRGSYALAILAAFTPYYVNAGIAAILIWTINILLPMIIGSFLFKITK